jgi:hypothetical protein
VADLYSSQQATALREDANMCKCKWVSCNVVRPNHSPHNYWM